MQLNVWSNGLISTQVVEMRYLLQVFQAHDPQRALADGWGPALRRELAVLHARFYGCLLAALVVLYASRRDARFLVFVAYSFWLPQIYRCAVLNVKEPVCDAYLYVMAASRLLLPLYALCDPNGLPRLLVVPSPDERPPADRAAFALGLALYQLLQVAVLKLQARYGARCFVPSALIPKPYDYRRPIAHLLDAQAAEPADAAARTPDGGGGGDARAFECPICMGDVHEGANHLVTPCDHVFHDVCLGQWMDLKSECPVCRSQLPPIDPGDGGDDAPPGDSPPYP